MKTVFNYLFLLMLFSIIACYDLIRDDSSQNNCFIIGGCDKSYYNLETIYIRLTVEIERKSQMQLTIPHNKSNGPNVNITLPMLHSVCGSIKYLESPVHANIRFIPDIPDTLTNPHTSETDQNGKFCTILKKGSYTILISPHKNDSTPQFMKKIEVNNDISDLTIDYPSADNIRYVYGNITLDSKSGIPVEGINVVAFKEYYNGITLQSNFSTTDEKGRFALIIPHKEDTFSLMLYGSEKNPDWPVIKFEDIISEGIIQIGTINLGFVPQLRNVSGSVSSNEKIRIVAKMESSDFNYTKSFISDSTGYFEAELREGKYTFLTIPEDIHNSRWSITTIDNIYVPFTNKNFSNINKKILLKGSLLPNQEKIVPKINIRRLGGCTKKQIDNVNIENSLVPNDRGEFMTYIHRGEYRIEIASHEPHISNLISEPICIEEDLDLGTLHLPESCKLSISVSNKTNKSIGIIKTETFIANYSLTDFAKIAEEVNNSLPIHLKVPKYFCK
ncbi:MAG: hypothetical protein N2746_11745 [Deltaproteobacteria bacterium]|nr:hypothetical protein [Deltaproteobacteria bacterium]